MIDAGTVPTPLAPGRTAGALTLSPTQATAFARLLETIRSTPITVLTGAAGSGKTTLVASAVRELGGIRLAPRDLIEAPAVQGQPAVEETLHRLLADRLEDHDLVFVEDVDLVCYTNKMTAAYPRPFYLQVALQSLFEIARTRDKHLVVTATDRDQLLPIFETRSVMVDIRALTEDDYRFFIDRGLGSERSRNIDAARVFAAAPKLSVSQLLDACALTAGGQVDSESLVDLVETRVLTSNVSLGEVARVTFSDLKGCDDVIESLETHIVIPMQESARFGALGLAAKRGVLLFGPPGTGKTSVGRALAHRLRGKFFMIDGTFIGDMTSQFYTRVRRVFELAKHNTPSVIFVDDADVLMQSDRFFGLNRFLLTMLDGLESETSGMVTVMLTAMDPNQLPQALVRSGRIELWLETRLPDASARAEIFAGLLGALPAPFDQYDAERIALLTEGFTGADVKRVVADAKALYAREVVRREETKTTDAYLEMAAVGVLANKTLLTAAQEGRLQTPTRKAIIESC